MPLEPNKPSVPKIDLKGLVVKEIIDRGDFEVICMGLFHPIQREVIIEITEFDKHPDPHPKGPFKDRARLLEKLNHPNIIRLIAWGVQDDIGYLVYEAEQKKRLVDHIRDKVKFSPRESLEIILAICQGLKHCHSLGMFHGEIRPSNILFSYDGKIKVRNFCLYKHEKEYLLQLLARRPHYISPEQIKQSAVNHTTDIYSVGIVLYELLTGEPPHRHEDIREIWRMHLEEDLPSLAEKYPECSKLDEVISKMTDKKPKFRYQNMQEAIQDLEELRDQFPMAMFEKFGRAALHQPAKVPVEAQLPHRKPGHHKVHHDDGAPVIGIMLTICFLLFGGFLIYEFGGSHTPSAPIGNEIEIKDGSSTTDTKNQVSPQQKNVEKNEVNNLVPPTVVMDPKEKKEKRTPAIQKETSLVQLIERQLNHPDVDVRRDALKKTISMPSEHSIPLLKKAMLNSDPDIRLLANQIIRDLNSAQYTSSASPSAEGTYKPRPQNNPTAGAKKTNTTTGTELIPMNPKKSLNENLLAATTHSDLKIRRAAMQELARIKDPKAIPLIIQAVGKGELTRSSYQPFTSYDDNHIPALMELLNTGIDQDAYALMQVLKQIGTESSSLALKKILLNHPQYAYRAATTLAGMGEHGEKVLIDTLGENRKSETLNFAFLGIKEIPYSEDLKDHLLQYKKQLSPELSQKIDLFLFARDPYYESNSKMDKETATTILSEFNTGTSKVSLTTIGQMIGKVDDTIDDKAYDILTKAGKKSLLALKRVVFGKFKDKVKLKAVAALVKIKTPETADVFIEYLLKHKYRESKDYVYDKILADISKLGDLAVNGLAKSELDLKLKISILSEINSASSKRTAAMLLKDNSPPQVKMVLNELQKNALPYEDTISVLLQLEPPVKIKRIVISFISENPADRHIAIATPLLTDGDDKIRDLSLKAILKILKRSPESWEQVYMASQHKDIKIQLIEEVPVEEEVFSKFAALVLNELDPDLRMQLIKKGLRSRNQDYEKLVLNHYQTESHKDVNELIARHFLRSGNTNIQFCIISMMKDLPSNLERKVNATMYGLKNTSDEMKELGRMLHAQPEYSFEIRSQVLKFLLDRNWPLTAKYLGQTIPVKDPMLKALYHNTLLKMGKKKTATSLLNALNRCKLKKNTRGIEEASSLMKSMNIPFSLNKETNRYVLE